jgi:hypothetical protein
MSRFQVVSFSFFKVLHFLRPTVSSGYDTFLNDMFFVIEISARYP